MSMGLIERAIEVATVAHKGQCRKGTDIPYIMHPFAVGMMLAKAGCDDEVVAAGILHDTVEDTDLTSDDIRNQFGHHVADLVAGASEPNKQASWEERKKHTLEYLKTAPLDVRMVSCADKLHNLRSVVRDYRNQAEALWGVFNRGKEQQLWYYTSLAESLVYGLDAVPPLMRDYQATVEELKALVNCG